MPLIPGSSRILRMRAVLGHRGRNTAQPRLERALRSADLEPAGLPAGSLLCVRRLRDPLPGRLGATEREVETNARWSQAARDSLGAIMATAARPQGGRLPARAGAVLFPTEADLLACFALAQAEGRVAGEWWWGCALSAADLGRAWPGLWGRNPAAIPSALHGLALGSNLSAVLRSLSAGAATSLTRQLAVTFGLSEIHQVLAHLPTALPPFAAATPRVAPRFPDRTPTAEPLPGPGVASTDFPPEITASEITAAAALPVETGLFMLFGLLLARNPARARRVAFVAFVRHVFSEPQFLLRCAAAAADARPDVALRANPASPRPAPALPSPSGSRAHPPAVSHAPGRQDDAGSPPEMPSSHRVDKPATSPRPPTAPPVSTESLLPGPEMTVTTAHGGVFYLLNLALALGLYGDFTQPLRSALALSPWDFLGRLGRRLLRDDPRAANDSLWLALEQLAGPPDELPESPILPADWEPDPAWSDQRLALPPAARSSVEDFLTWLIPVLSRRLESAGVTFPLLLDGFARVVLTAGRVDVHFSLSSHPIPIRLAGLDRDPGWIPAAGRDVRFHYD
ncbi:MAG TPA: hypothetical protein VG734_12585 [Lacunisphaera sp.]|nr:hypothetical protein [Lacunisphaera sp.]